MNYKLDKDQIVKNFLPKIKIIALNLMSNLPKNVQLDDLIQEGVIGLLQAYERYDPSHGASFYTYALTRIKGAMLDYLRKIDWLPKELRHLIKEYETYIYDKNHEYISDEQIIKDMNISSDDLSKIKVSISKSQILELDSYITDNNSDFPVNNYTEKDDPEVKAYEEILKESLQTAVEKLKEKEKVLLSLYYEKNLTFKEIGEVLGVSESRISQIHSAVLIKLKKLVGGDE